MHAKIGSQYKTFRKSSRGNNKLAENYKKLRFHKRKGISTLLKNNVLILRREWGKGPINRALCT